MQQLKVKKIGVLLLTGTMVIGALRPCKVSADFKDTLYMYRSAYDGDYSMTEWREKEYGHANTPYGYVYAIASEGLNSSVLVRKKKNSGSTADCSNGYVTIPDMTHTCIRNNFTLNNDKQVRLRVRTNTNSGITSGYWSPDCSKQYGNIVG